MPLSCQNFLITVFLFTSITVCGQSSLDSVAGQFAKYVRAERKEKTIVLTDKPFYKAGEDIWLKGWCLDSLSNRFIYLSKNLFVDLVNDKDSVIGQLLFNIPGRKTSGMIPLPATLQEGYYWLRAYTSKILKEDKSRIFVKPIFVVNSNKPDPRAMSAYVSKEAPLSEDTAAPRLIFYPEGGSIISGTTANVGFRSLGARGQAVDVAGFVTDPLHDTVAKFGSSLSGLGKFSFDAYNPRKYTAHIMWRGRDVLYPLPLLDQFASQLTIISRDERTIKLQVSLGDSLYKKHKVTRILGVSRDSLCFGAVGTDMYQVNVPVANFPAGKAIFLLFDDHDRMVSQRFVYIGASDTNRIVASTDKAGYSPGEKVNLSIGVKSANDLSQLAAILSVSVTDDRLTGERAGVSGANELGFPGLEDTLARNYSPAALDLLMLAQPRTYIDWGSQAGATAMNIVQFADSNLLNLRGKAVNKNNDPLNKYIINLVSGDNRFFLADTTDAQGRFDFPLSEYDDGTKFNMKITDIHGKATEGKLILDKLDYPQFHTPRELKRGLGNDELAMIRRYKSQHVDDEPPGLKDSTLLKPATVEARKKLPDYDEAKRVSPFSQVIGPDQLRKGGVDEVYNALSRVPGLTSGVNRTMSLGIGGGSEGTSSFYVVQDGIPVNTGGDVKVYLESLDATNIEFIEVLTGPLTAIYGMEGAPGVILITSVTGHENTAQTNDKGLTTIFPKGYYNQSDVFASGFDKKKPSAPAGSTTTPSTLYWNANVLTDNKGNAKVDFFTGHQQAMYSAAIVGITMGGDIVRKKIQIRCQ